MTSSALNPANPTYPNGATPDARSERRSLFGQALYDTFGNTGAKLGAVWIIVIAFLAIAAPFLANSHPILYREHGGKTSSPLLAYLTPIDVILVILFALVMFVLSRRLSAGLTVALCAWPVAVLGVVAAIWKFGIKIVTLRLIRPESLSDGEFTAGDVLLWAFLVITHLLAAALVVGAAWLVWRATLALWAATARRRLLFAASGLATALMIIAAFLVRPAENPVYSIYREAQAAGKVDLVVRTLIPFSPNDRRRDQQAEVLVPPGSTHWMGTTVYGEDMLSRMLHATRVALAIGFIATGISTVIGVTLGGLMGYYGGRADLVGMRFLEIIESIPTLILLLIVTVFVGRDLYLMMVVIGLITWTSDARFIRAEFLRLRNLDFVQAAVAAGLKKSSIIFRHMLPNGVAPVLVNASFGIAGAILLESTLSFLGLGLDADESSWGQLLLQAHSSGGGFNWWIATFPGLAIFLTVFSYILIGEAMRDAIDPKLKKSQG